MEPLEIIFELIDSNFENTKFWTPAAISMLIMSGTLLLLAKCKHWRYRAGIISIAAGLAAAVWNLLLEWNCDTLYRLAGLLILVPPLLLTGVFLWNKYCLAKVRKLCDQHFYTEALKRLNAIKPGWLTGKQLRDYQKRRFFLLISLGSLRKARAYLEEICPEKKALYHFFLHILVYQSGDLDTSLREIQAAEDSSDLTNDPFLRFEIIVNHGVCYAAQKNYHLADEYYRKALAFYKEKRIQDSELLDTFYYNFVFNQLRLNPGGTEWQEALDEYQSKLDMKKTDAQIRILNLRLELLRQTEAPREAIDKLLQEVFSTAKRKLPLKNQVFLAASAARVAWAAQVNPIPFLNLLNDNLSVIEGLSANQRYNVYADLDNLFRDLHGPVNDIFASLRTRVSNYLKDEAESDLRKWRDSLPEEAVYERCDCLKKMAILRRSQTPYNRDHVVSRQQDAIRLYHDNQLYLTELHTRQDVIDELLDPRNRDDNHRPVCFREIQEHLAAAEELLSHLSGHPAIAEVYIRLGCYCLELDDYKQSIHYARLFRGTNISVQNFAPWIRRYYAILLLHMRVILFDQAIKEASADKRLRSFSKDIRDWFASYPRHDGGLETVLLGRFLSVPVEKMKIWIPNGDTEPQGHIWLWIPGLELSIDLTYPQFEDDLLCPCMFFHGDRHPFESGTSLTLQISQQNASTIFEGIAFSAPEYRVTPEEKAFADAIYNHICSYIPQDCPTMEAIDKLFQEFTAPVPIQNGEQSESLSR